MSPAFQLRKPSSRHGDDVAPVRECRGTTPLAHTRVRRSSAGDDGPTRSGLLGWLSCSSESSPVMAGSVLLTTILVPGQGHPVNGLGIVFERYEPDDVTIRLPWREYLTNDGAYFHGGVYRIA
jgi:hypothetical protein